MINMVFKTHSELRSKFEADLAEVLLANPELVKVLPKNEMTHRMFKAYLLVFLHGYEKGTKDNSESVNNNLN